jgi:hypothetical protein
MVVINLSLYRERQEATRIISSKISSEFQCVDIKKLSGFIDAWNTTQDIYLRLCNDPSVTSSDRKRINELKSKIFRDIMILMKGENR